MTIFNAISLFGGLSLFLYGMRIMGDGLKRGSSEALKRAMEKITNNPIIGFLLGLLVTCVIQSSTATIVLTSGLVGAGIITLHQSMGIILGANVGTTITGQIIRLLDLNSNGAVWLEFFKPSTLAPIACIVGILLIMAFHFRASDTIGGIAIGFGILFTGLLNMTAAVSPLSQSPTFAELFITLADKPVLGYLAGAGVAFLIQSSSATVGILQALSVTGQLTFSSVYAILIGIYLGDCVTTAIVCSIGAKADARRTGLVHILFNLCESVLVIIAVYVLHHSGTLDGIWNKAMSSGDIANTHTLFKLLSALLLLPACSLLEKLSRRIVKDDPEEAGTPREKLLAHELETLDKAFFTSPALALSSAQHNISALAGMAENNVHSALEHISSLSDETLALINEDEDCIDSLADHVSNYLVNLSPHVDAEHGSDRLNYYLKCITEFERIGDYAVNLTENAANLKEKNAAFSATAVAELALVSKLVYRVLALARRAFVSLDYHAAREIEPLEEVVDDLVETLRANHVKRLREGKCGVDAGFVFLDALVNIERISDQCSNIGVYTVALFDRSVEDSMHDYVNHLHRGYDEEFNRRYNETHKEYYNALSELEA